MNREIKFRAWDYFNEVMIYDSDDESDFKFYNGKYIVKYVTGQHTVENGIDIDRPIWNQVDGPVMQYTGLKDKDGKEVYEGDVVKIKAHGVCEVSFSSGCFIIKGELGYQNPITHQYSGERCTVIGNIYENPELLKQ